MSDLEERETRRAVRDDVSLQFFPVAEIEAVPPTVRPTSLAPRPSSPAPRRIFEIDSLPSFFVAPPALLSAPSSGTDRPATGASTSSTPSAATFRKAVQGVVAFSAHWGTPRILVDIKENVTARQPEDPRSRLLRLAASHDLAARTARLLRESGLTQRDETFGSDVPSRRLSFGDAEFLPPVIRVSIPAHFGVDLMFLAGAALRPLTARPVLFVGMCEGLEASLKQDFDQSDLDSLRRFATRFPKHRLVDLYPLLLLIGASFGVSRGVLNGIIRSAPSPSDNRTTGSRQGQDPLRKLAALPAVRPIH